MPCSVGVRRSDEFWRAWRDQALYNMERITFCSSAFAG